eukprot:scaffold143775_cov66-Cyclotella_meneghiniana.AAC.1
MVSTVSMVGFDVIHVIDGFDGVELKLRTLMPIRLDDVGGFDDWIESIGLINGFDVIKFVHGVDYVDGFDGWLVDGFNGVKGVDGLRFRRLQLTIKVKGKMPKEVPVGLNWVWARNRWKLELAKNGA